MSATAAVLGFGAASWKTKASQHLHRVGLGIRQRNLPPLQETDRYVIVSRARLPRSISHLAAHVILCLPVDWQRRDRSRPVLIKRFAEQEQPTGICLRARNWIHIGQKRGRGNLAVRSQFRR